MFSPIILVTVCITNYYNNMRSVVNISLPFSFNEVIEQAVVQGQYASKSEFFRDLLRAWMEGRILKSLKYSREEIKSGKGKLLKSLSDLR